DSSIYSEPMQSAGLLDKNGREVYESDIVKMLSGELLLVEFNHGMCEPICYYTSDSFEVVGSIFENPELLEKVE
ncbi:YopX family protein, partial [Atopobiaceae bacterium HCP3S3_F7]